MSSHPLPGMRNTSTSDQNHLYSNSGSVPSSLMWRTHIPPICTRRHWHAKTMEVHRAVFPDSPFCSLALDSLSRDSIPDQKSSLSMSSCASLVQYSSFPFLSLGAGPLSLEGASKLAPCLA